MADATDPLATPSFTWVRDLLWPAGSEPGDHTYALLTRRDRPRAVVPLGSRRALRTVLGRTSGDVGRRQRLLRRVAATGAGLGLVQLLLRRRFAPQRPADAPPIEEVLASALGSDRVVVAATIGPRRPNAKPVLQVLTPDGRTAAFAKIGWNGLTRSLVRHEVATLRRLEAKVARTIVAPRVLYAGRWRDLELSVLSPLEPAPGESVRRDPTTSELVALADLGERSSSALAGSPYADRLRKRIGAVPKGRTELYRAALDQLVADAGSTRLEFGFAHGDWTPWNMAPLEDRLMVWDWERSGDGVPVLADTIHYVFQREWLRRRQTTEDALRSAIDHAGRHAGGFGLEPGATYLIAGLYLVDLGLRYTENAAAGTDELRGERHAAVDAQISALL